MTKKYFSKYFFFSIIYVYGKEVIFLKKIYTSIDLGSDSIKIVVCEKVNRRFHVLASSSVRSAGIKKGVIVDEKMVIQCLNTTIKKIEKKVGFKIEKAIINVPAYNLEFNVVTGCSLITNEEGIVTGKDISGSIKDAVSSKKKDGYEVVNILPINFTIDDNVDGVKDPKGLRGNELNVKAVMISVPTSQLYPIANVFKTCGIEVIDMSFNAVGDYCEIRNQDTDNSVCAIINIGSETTNISIHNKGIMIKDITLDFGALHIDKDISYVYRVDKDVARNLKENFAVSSKKYTDSNDCLDVTTVAGEKLTINQYEISEVVESRLEEMLKISKKALNDLTKREISYIIITGGISELAGFQYVVENIFGRIATVHNITNLGIRSNIYSSCIGFVKYFDNKLMLRDDDYSTSSRADSSQNGRRRSNTNSDNIVSKVFDMFTGN